MYNQQNFHTSSYRGNQQGHDNYLHSDSQSASMFGGQAVSSQYRGLARSFQPTGQVQSVYNQTATSYSQAPSYSTSYGTPQNVNAFHTSGYKGDQQGHDAYLRSDTRAMQNSGFGTSSSFGTTGVSYQTGFGTQQPQSQFGYGMQAQGQYGNQAQTSFGASYQMTNPNTFHTAAYKGNMQGHDQSLHGDSFSPSQQGVSTSMGRTSGYSTGVTGGSFGGTGSYMAGSSYQGLAGAEQFHTSGYRGNQQGHDSYLHADSRTPSSTGSFGFSGGATRF